VGNRRPYTEDEDTRRKSFHKVMTLLRIKPLRQHIGTHDNAPDNRKPAGLLSTIADIVRIMLCPNMTPVDCEHDSRANLASYVETICVKRANSQCTCSAVCKLATVVKGRLETSVTTANSNTDGTDRGEVIRRLSFETVPFLVRIVNSARLSFHSDNYGS
jgi:hypothetical protein